MAPVSASGKSPKYPFKGIIKACYIAYEIRGSAMIFSVDLTMFKVLRLARNKSQAEVADLAGTTQAKVSAIESGRANPETATLSALCGALDAELILVPRRIGGDVRRLVDLHLNRRREISGSPMSVRDELFIPDGDD
ncbi:helix-turn-helix domain-containing protein [Rhizobium sp. Rhizsp82]|uniref:helix-turn-helix domain-containing protein n=1 Tax=Rhizobium sp. Rhizsp82 TaxID=3243057 RepID=UPI0039B48568